MYSSLIILLLAAVNGIAAIPVPQTITTSEIGGISTTSEIGGTSTTISGVDFAVETHAILN